ncbi:MAG: DEAD/DEAH box helicase, partial [Bacteroidaceae bacterium]
MQIQALTQAYASHPQVKALWHAIHATKGPVCLCGMQGSSLPMAFAALFGQMSKTHAAPLLFVMNDAEEAGYFFHDLHQMLPDGSVLFFPSSFRRDVKYGQRDADNEIMRTEVLTHLQSGSALCYVVTYPQALAEMVVTRDTLSHLSLTLRQGEKAEPATVQEMLVELGFTRTDYVYAPGQFAVRGSLVDVYAFNNENPYRIDFFGDEVDSIRLFNVSDQLSISRLEKVTIVPNLTASAQRMQCFLDFLNPATLVVSPDLKLACDMVEQTYRQGFTAQALAVEAVTEVDEHEARLQLERDMLLVKPDVFRRKADAFRLLSVRPQPEAEAPGAVVHFHTRPQPQFNKNFELLFQTLQPYVAQGFSLYMLADSEKQNQRLAQIFTDHTPSYSFIPVDHTIHGGFLDDDLKAVFLTDHQIFDRFHKFNVSAERARQGRVALTLKELQQFELGDYVVHIDHGIGRFGGLVRIPNGDRTQEVIKIIYKNDDVIFVSIHSLHKIYKYKGREGEQPRINALGTGAWERMKERTKAKIKDIARDLILLYSKRREEKGFAFSPDSYLQHELEASFRYEDTPDQLKATNDVKSDMERARPMDRLVCGDVGFGKTEVAIRAAFKACADGKQVAVMVPTTVLAYQHLNTFKERLRDMPVRVEYLSRARTPAQTKALLADLAEGRIDIIVGTQKLIGKSVRFKDLGLLIIDEEQKFGVATKERIRQLKPNVDTLTLTATPIPRTLQFSLMGARDLSVIQTPPPNRYPIQTQVCPFSPEIIAEAVNFEMSRGGQVFLVSNR